MTKQDLAQELFSKLVKNNPKLAERCIKETVGVEEMNKAVTEFMKTRSAKKILSKYK